MEKDKLYYSIGEVAKQFNINESNLRFWEKEFDIISPRKNAKGTRFYTKKDIDNISLIYHLLKEKGMTIPGARRKLKENKSLVIKNFEIIEKLKGIKLEIQGIMKEMETENKG